MWQKVLIVLFLLIGVANAVHAKLKKDPDSNASAALQLALWWAAAAAVYWQAPQQLKAKAKAEDM